MPWTMRVSLPGYNALTDGTIDHYSVYADNDNILIKEEARGTITLSNNSFGTITHNLGYVPYAQCYMKNGNNFENIAGGDLYNDAQKFYVGTNSLVVANFTGGTKTFYYYIFYDNGTASL